MNIKQFLILMLMCSSLFFSCKQKQDDVSKVGDEFNYIADQFADVKILRYRVPDFDKFSLNQKLLLYYLNEAALNGRDIVFDQNFKYNLAVRRTLENIYDSFEGDRNSQNWNEFVTYMKKVWFANGIHHHYSNDKFVPGFDSDYFSALLNGSNQNAFPIIEGQSKEQFFDFISKVIFDPSLYAKRVDTNAEDVVMASSVNFYDGVSQKEVEDFYNEMVKNGEPNLSYGLNSRLVKKDGKIYEQVYKIGGLYGDALLKVTESLEKAVQYAENQTQKETIEKLIEYYKSGDLKVWDDYNITWVNDTASSIDFVNGFIEVYTDPMGRKATWESVVNFKDEEATKKTEIISANAKWFEDNSPIDDRFKKKDVKGVSAKVINVSMLGGDCYPTTPIGINLPNANWIRKEHGSKSVTLTNITDAYDRSSLVGKSALEEFAYSNDEKELVKKFGPVAGNLHTDLHECLGHGSGQLNHGVSEGALKNFHSPMEEARADLFALYYMMDNKLVELGIMPTVDVAKAEYSNYIRNGLLTQLARIDLGKNIEQAHMRARALISNWVYEAGKAENVIEKKVENGKTYFVINDYDKLRGLFGRLLNKLQTIKSTGDYNSAKELVETYAVKVDPDLHKEVKERYDRLGLKPYSGFINPEYELVKDDKGEIIDVKISYPDDFIKQNLEYAKNHSFLKSMN